MTIPLWLKGNDVTWCVDGPCLKDWASYHQVSLAIMGLSAPLVAIYVAHHRSEQQVRLFIEQRRVNQQSEYFNSLKLFTESFDSQVVGQLSNEDNYAGLFSSNDARNCFLQAFTKDEDFSFLVSGIFIQRMNSNNKLVSELQILINQYHRKEAEELDVYRGATVYLNEITKLFHWLKLVSGTKVNQLADTECLKLIKISESVNQFLNSMNAIIYFGEQIKLNILDDDNKDKLFEIIDYTKTLRELDEKVRSAQRTNRPNT